MPFIIHNIVEEDFVVEYLKKRMLLDQYLKAKHNILSGLHTGSFLKYREPKHLQTLYFRINRQYRDLCQKRGETLVVFDIDNHQ